jgi:Transposase IS4
MKDAGYVSMFMSTYGTLERKDHKATRYPKINGRIEKNTFMLPEVFSNHCKYKSLIDSHNAKRHAPISLETTWATKQWPNRVFSFLLAVTEVNCFLVSKYFYNQEYENMIDFRQKFADALINNGYDMVSEKTIAEFGVRRSKRKGNGEDHELLSLPKKTKFKQSSIVPSTSDYPQFKCVGCTKRVRTYCRCSPGVLRCNSCFAKHFAAADNEL